MCSPSERCAGDEDETTDDLLVRSFDGQGIAMRLADLREAMRKKADDARANRTRTRLISDGKKVNAARMAESRCVYGSRDQLRYIKRAVRKVRMKSGAHVHAARPADIPCSALFRPVPPRDERNVFSLVAYDLPSDVEGDVDSVSQTV